MENLETRSLLSATVIQLSANLDNTIYDVSTGDQANGMGQFIVTGGSSGTAAARRGLLAFDIAAAGIPAGSTILDVVLTMNLAQSQGAATPVGLHRATKAWGEGFSDASGNETEGANAGAMDATWLFARYDGIAWASAGGDFADASSTVTVSTRGVYEWFGGRLISDVQTWLTNPASNFGWVVKSAEAAGNVKSFNSRNSGNAALRPALEITYEEPVLPGIVEGRKWHDKNANGLRESAPMLGLGLRYMNGNSRFNQFGENEYWYWSDNTKSWYYLTPNGSLTRWSGQAGQLTGKVIERLDARVWYSPDTLLWSAQKSDEPWMNEFTFELVNSVNQVVATTKSRDIDRNGDRVIQEEDETGWYRFENVAPGNYTVREVVPDGWMQSVSITSPGALAAFRLDVSLGLTVSGGLHDNFGGAGERWLKGTKGWYYITPMGDFYKWDGRSVTSTQPLGGTWIASPGASYFQDVSLLHAARNPVLNVKPGSVVSRIDFGNYQPTILSGQSPLAKIPAWIRNSPQFTAVPVTAPLPGSTTISGVPSYRWQIVVVSTIPMGLVPAANGYLSSPGVWYQIVSGSRLVKFNSNRLLQITPQTIFQNSLDQSAYRILDVLFSTF